jgi:hypothetical protein
VVGVVLIAAFVTTGGNAWAGSAVKLCVPKAEGSAALTPKHGKCKKGYTLTTLDTEGPAGAEGKQGAAGNPGSEGKQGLEGKQGPEGKGGPAGIQGPEGIQGLEGKQGPQGKNALGEEELSTLKGILRCIKSVKEGIGGKPTVQFSGCNVQIVNGAGKTATINGAGNLVIGYDENEVGAKQTGSHNLVLGEGQSFTSHGGLLAGLDNTVSNPFASVSGGQANNATGGAASVSGGFANKASGSLSSVSGGNSNGASGEQSSVSGGELNTASGVASSILGLSSVIAPNPHEAIPYWCKINGSTVECTTS